MLRALIREVTITTIYNASLSFDIKAQMGQHTWLALSQRRWRPCTTSAGCTIITSTNLTGASATWTSSGAGSALTPIYAAPFALVGAAPAGMLAFYAKSEGIQWERFRVLRSCAECIFWYIYEVDYRFLTLYANLAIWILILR
ncbi:hypothetical protein N7489_004274 [Penicillium chrysogenum]|uniref:Uncharacterized protein n=1 Tax=Penicillium chrysogenum TaxID=5076 RepID=A0ABQ8WS74_PENCH|nr:uncharacterized protein N7489_004274 [Penicillium chrysogenum]KAJ5244178.1 hypothetical protein N7489_004274 [Penicillium chrysogenum]KAJ5275194.1 hypothetical protein N7505_003739 [Penicillium chrysogenum]KAJ6156923.1 hypothetical protein N7497_005808 [Penicillium chrysogenum]